MHPLLLQINLGFITLPIHTYGLMFAIGFLSAVTLVRRLAEKSGVNADLVSDLCFWLLLSGFFGARGLFVFRRWKDFLASPLDIFKVWEGGLVFFGGLLGATAYAFYFFKKHRLSAWTMIDVLAPGLVLGHAFGRLGCFGAGCCYGLPTGMPWGVRLNSELVDIQFRGIPLHPTQLYESFSLLILLGGMLYIFKHRKFPGQVGLFYFMMYPIIRSIVEIFRGDSIRGFIIEDVLSTSQFISIFIFLAAFVIWVRRLSAVDMKSNKQKK